MAIPNILLAIAIVALSGASLWTVLIAITIPEVPRVVRLVRSVVLSAREGALCRGGYGGRLLDLADPDAAPVAQYRRAPESCRGRISARPPSLIEAILSFLGARYQPGNAPPGATSWLKGGSTSRSIPASSSGRGLVLSVHHSLHQSRG